MKDWLFTEHIIGASPDTEYLKEYPIYVSVGRHHFKNSPMKKWLKDNVGPENYVFFPHTGGEEKRGHAGMRSYLCGVCFKKFDDVLMFLLRWKLKDGVFSEE
jgi:hypothetical protein